MEDQTQASSAVVTTDPTTKPLELIPYAALAVTPDGSASRTIPDADVQVNA